MECLWCLKLILLFDHRRQRNSHGIRNEKRSKCVRPRHVPHPISFDGFARHSAICYFPFWHQWSCCCWKTFRQHHFEFCWGCSRILQSGSWWFPHFVDKSRRTCFWCVGRWHLRGKICLWNSGSWGSQHNWKKGDAPVRVSSCSHLTSNVVNCINFL